MVTGSAEDDLTPFEQAVEKVLAGLEPGDVVTYGEVAAEAGYPGRARAVGTFLARRGDGYPWWRVVTASGRLVPGHEADHARPAPGRRGARRRARQYPEPPLTVRGSRSGRNSASAASRMAPGSSAPSKDSSMV